MRGGDTTRNVNREVNREDASHRCRGGDGRAARWRQQHCIFRNARASLIVVF